MIITDSLSSLQALKSQKLNNPIVSNILHMCHYLSGHKDIVFCWVPSHIGIQGNERADVLAKAALDKTKQFYYIPYTDFKYNISVYLDDILQGEWNINVTSKLFEVQPIIRRSFTPMERGTGMIASSSTFRPHPGRVIRDLFRLLDAVTALYGSTSLQQSSKGSCSLLVSGYNLRADCQWRTLVPPLNSGANAAPASVLALM